jgi:hypothetical protein
MLGVKSSSSQGPKAASLIFGRALSMLSDKGIIDKL